VILRFPQTGGLATSLELALDLALGVALGEVVTLVTAGLAACQRQLDLDAPGLEIEPGRYERQALLIQLTRERVDLAPAEQELAVAVGIVGAERGLLVGSDVGTDEPELAGPDLAEGAREIGLALAK